MRTLRSDLSPKQLDPNNLESLSLNLSLFLCRYWNLPILWVNTCSLLAVKHPETRESRLQHSLFFRVLMLGVDTGSAARR